MKYNQLYVWVYSISCAISLSMLPNAAALLILLFTVLSPPNGG